MLIDQKNYRTTVENIIKQSNKLSIAVAFWGYDVEKLFQEKSPESSLIICNLSMGGTNPRTIKALINMGFTVHQLNTLHAKMIISENEVIIGSANLSANGLSLNNEEISGWDEIGFLSNDKLLIQESNNAFSELWEKSRPINNSDLEKAQELWGKRRAQRPILQKEKSLFERDLTELKDREICIFVWRNNASPNADDAFKNFKETEAAKISNARNLDFFQDLDQLPKNTSIITIYFGRRGKIKVEGIFRRIPELDFIFDETNPQESNIQIAIKEKDAAGFKLTKKDVQLLTQIIQSKPNIFLQNSAEIDIFSINEFISKTKLHEFLTGQST